jgi:hypothetical protein
MHDARRCTATRLDGEPCKAQALPGGDRCLFHDPQRREQVDLARRAGGISSRRGPTTLPPDTADLPLATVADVSAALAQTINLVRRGQLDAKTANSAGYLLNVLLRALEGDALERQIEEMRQEMEALHRHDQGIPSPRVAAVAGTIGSAAASPSA